MASDATPEQVASVIHHHIYGYPGRVQETRVKPGDWKTKPFETPRREQLPAPGIPITSADDITRLLNGYKPEQMEDKWFVYADETDEQGKTKVHCYRSWTGYKVGLFEIQLLKVAAEELDLESESGSESGSVSVQSMETSDSEVRETKRTRPLAYITAFEWETNNQGKGMGRNKAMEWLHQVSCWVLGTSSWELPDAYKGEDEPESNEAQAATNATS